MQVPVKMNVGLATDVRAGGSYFKVITGRAVGLLRGQGSHTMFKMIMGNYSHWDAICVNNYNCVMLVASSNLL